MENKPITKVMRALQERGLTGRVAVLALGLAVLAAAIWILLPENGAIAQSDGQWRYTADAGEAQVKLLAADDPQVPTIEYQFGDAGLRLTLLQDSLAIGEVKGTELNDGTLVLQGIYPGTEVEYQAIENGLKEDIVLLRREAADAFPGAPTYGFALVTDNAEPARDEIGRIQPFFVNKGTGEYAFHLPEPFMVDAVGAESRDIEVRLRRTQVSDVWFDAAVDPAAQWLLVMSPSLDWLLDEAREYPVRIDPTVVHDEQADFTGTYDGVEWDTQAGDSAAGVNLEEASGYGTSSNTKLLLEMDGTPGSTAFTDTTGNHTVTAVDGAALSADDAWSGPTSGYFDGSGDYLTVPHATDWAFGSGDFSIDAWVKVPSGTDLWQTTVNQGVSGATSDSAFSFGVDNTPDDSRLFCALTNGGGSWDVLAFSDKGHFRDDEWHHIACVRSGDTLILFVDGQQRGTYALSGGYVVNDSSRVLEIGTRDGGTDQHGFIDNFRITKGEALWDSDFAPPARNTDGAYTSQVIDSGASTSDWSTLTWTEANVLTGDGETEASSTGLVAEWNFNETSGTTAASGGTCGSSCNGTLTNFASTGSQDAAAGTGWTTDNARWGAGALMFDGSNDFVSVPHNSAYNLETVTLETWLKVQAPGAATTKIFEKWGASSQFPYVLRMASNGNVYFSAYDGTNNPIAVGTDIADGQWHHVAGTRTKGSELKIYVDGLLIATATDTTSGDTTNTDSMGIGASPTGAAPFPGMIDSTRIYSRALSADEIRRNAQVGNIQLQTRTGDTATPDDGTWEEWKPVTGETQLLSLDSDNTNWAWGNTPTNAPLATSNEASIKNEGSGSLQLDFGVAQANANSVGLWNMEETAGTGAYIQDSSGEGNHATPQGTVAAVDGVSGKAIGLDGAGDYLSVPDAAELNVGSGDFTVVAWVKSTAAQQAGVWPTVVGKQTLTGGMTGWNITLNAQSTATANVYADMYVGGTWGGVVSNTNVRDGKWHQVVLVKDSTTAYIYVDGVLDNSAAHGLGAGSLSSSGESLTIGRHNLYSGNQLDGSIDGVHLMTGVAQDASWVAEQYRLGRDHRIGRAVSTDLSDDSLLTVMTASDRPGTHSELTVGESAYANYESDANTVALWHMEEAAGTGAYLFDSSGNGHHATPSGTSQVDGHVGKARDFNGSSDYAVIDDHADLNFGTSDFSIGVWVKTDQAQVAGWYPAVIAKDPGGSGRYGWTMLTHTSDSFADATFEMWSNDSIIKVYSGVNVRDGEWHRLDVVKTATTLKMYVDGVLGGNVTHSQGSISNVGTKLMLGNLGPSTPICATCYYDGLIDEVVISDNARTAAEIRQAYEIGARTRGIKTDFAAELQSANDIDSTADLSFTVDGTGLGLTQPAAGLYAGDMVIVKENYGSTEYVVQGTVDSVNQATGAVTVSAWSGTAPPTVGFTAGATVMKWQKQVLDLSGIPAVQRDGAARLTVRQYAGGFGKTLWLDDARSITNYLTDPAAPGNIASADGQYLQYRAIMTSPGGAVSPSLQSVTTQYNSAPVAVGDSASTAVDTPVDIDVLANDSDPNVGDTLTPVIVTQPSNGTATLNGDQVTYTPTSSYDDDFNDGSISDLKWDITEVADALVVEENGKLKMTVGGGSSYSVALATQNGFGALSGDFDVQVDWSANLPATEWSLCQLVVRSSNDQDKMNMQRTRGRSQYGNSYRATERVGGSWGTHALQATTDTSGQMRITRTGSSITAYYYNSGWQALKTATVTAADMFTYLDCSSNSAAYPQFTAEWDNFTVVTGDPTFFVGTDSFTYKANDGIDDSNTVTVEVVVGNNAPVAVDDTGYTVSEGATLTVSAGSGVLANDTDANDDALTATGLDDSGLEGSVTLNADGSFEYVPPADWAGPDSFTYYANDGTADSASPATVTIDVVTADRTVVQAATLERQKAGESGTFDLTFTLENTITGPLTVTFPTAGAPATGFTVTGAFTGGSCAGGGTISNFTYDAGHLYADKVSCTGVVTVTGATVTNPTEAGLYTVSWVNDDEGEVVIPVLDDDTVSVTGNIDPTLTFDLDVSLADGESGATYSVDLGTLSTSGPSGSDNSAIPSIWIDLSTNASGGATVTVSSLYQALRSVSNPSDEIASATATLAGGTEGYGICVASATGTQDGGDTFAAQGNYAGSCDGATFAVGALAADATPANLLVTSGPVSSGRSEVRVGASMSTATPAHPDYTDTLTFTATATY
jgi:hypothetical protein